LTLMRAKCGLASQDDHPLLIRVMRVERPELGTRLDLGHARADELTADATSDERLLDAPPVTLTGFVPLVAEEVERLHRRRTLTGHEEERRGLPQTPPPAGGGVVARLGGGEHRLRLRGVQHRRRLVQGARLGGLATAGEEL